MEDHIFGLYIGLIFINRKYLITIKISRPNPGAARASPRPCDWPAARMQNRGPASPELRMRGFVQATARRFRNPRILPATRLGCGSRAP